LAELSGEELAGACKITSFFLDALEGEINLAYNVVGSRDFEAAAIKVREAADKVNYNQYDEAIRLVSEAISNVASSGQSAMQKLKNHNLL